MAESAPGLWAGVRALPRPVWILCTGTFVNRFGAFVVFFLILYLTDLGYSPVQAGLAASAYGAGGVTAMVIGGHLADRLGRRISIALSMFSSAAAMIALSQARALPLIILFAALAGTAAELHRPASAALLTDLTAPGQRRTAFAVYRIAVNAGVTVGPGIAGLLAERSFLLVFLADALTSILFGVISLLALPDGTRVRASEDAGGLLRAVRTDGSFLRLLAGSALAAFVFLQVHSTLPLYVVDAGYSKAMFGALVSLNAAFVVLFELPLTHIASRFPARRVIALGFLLVGAGFGATGFAHTAPLIALTIVIWSVGEVLSLPVAAAVVADQAPEHLRGRYQALFALVFAASFVVAPPAGTALYSWSPAGLWGICFLLGIAAAALVRAGRDEPAAVAQSPAAPSAAELAAADADRGA